MQGTLKPVPDLTSHCNELTVWALHSQRMATHVTGTILQHRPLPPVTHMYECMGGVLIRERGREGGREEGEGGKEGGREGGREGGVHCTCIRLSQMKGGREAHS